MTTSSGAGDARGELGSTTGPQDDITLENVRSYRSSQLRVFPAEQKILNTLGIRDRRVLDIGCGNGRITRWLLEKGADVYATDLSAAAVRFVAERIDWFGRHRVVQADVRSLPFRPETFQIVVFAFNGIDFLHPVAQRRTALEEISRVLQPGGHFVFSSHNPIGWVLSPRGLRSPRHLRWRAGYVAARQYRDRYARDEAGLRMHQAGPEAVISEVQEVTNLRFVMASNRHGNVRSLALIRIFSAWPYFVFEKMQA